MIVFFETLGCRVFWGWYGVVFAVFVVWLLYLVCCVIGLFVLILSGLGLWWVFGDACFCVGLFDLCGEIGCLSCLFFVLFNGVGLLG